MSQSQLQLVHIHEPQILYETKLTYFLTAHRPLKTNYLINLFHDVIALFKTLLLTPCKEKLVHYILHNQRLNFP